MRFSLRGMMIAVAIAPPVLAWLWMVFGYFLILAAIYSIAVVLLIDDRTC